MTLHNRSWSFRRSPWLLVLESLHHKTNTCTMMMKQASWKAVFCLLFVNSVAADTLRQLILDRPNLSKFRSALQAVGLFETYLNDPTISLTIFAPTDEDIDADPAFSLYLKGLDESPPRWDDHLRDLVNHHLADGLYTYDVIFPATGSSIGPIPSRFGELSTIVLVKSVGNARFGEADIMADNGVLHIMDRVMTPSAYQNSFKDILLDVYEFLDRDTTKEDYPRVSYSTVVNVTNGWDILDQVNDNGLTMAGCRLRALNRMGVDYLPQTINDSNDVKFGELVNETFAEETKRNFIEYSLIPEIIDIDELPNRYQELYTPIADCGHMWVTKDEFGTVCFNDGCVVVPEGEGPRTFKASNGVGYVVDKCPICPGVAMLNAYTDEYTNHQTGDTAQLFRASQWNLRNLSLSIGSGQKLTVFSPTDSAWQKDVDEDVVVRVSTLKYIRHLWNFLEHMAIEGEFTRQDLIDLWNTNGQQPYNMTSVSGEDVEFDYDPTTETLTIDGGDIYFSDIRGVDGLLHLVQDYVPKPISVTHDVYEMGTIYEEYSSHVLLIDTLVDIRDDMKRLEPLTAMYAPNDKWTGNIIELDEIGESVIKNMLFKEMMWCDYLQSIAGQTIESLNGQEWTIEINEKGLPCFKTAAVFGGATVGACIAEGGCDILANNGIVHRLEELLLFEEAATLPPNLQDREVPPSWNNPAAPIWYTPQNNRVSSPAASPNGQPPSSNPDPTTGSGVAISFTRVATLLGFVAAILWI